MQNHRRLPADAVRQWLVGHREAQVVIERERRDWLVTLGQDEALRIYLELASLPRPKCAAETVSPVLLAMRRAIERRNRVGSGE